jgi:sortase A
MSMRNLSSWLLIGIGLIVAFFGVRHLLIQYRSQQNAAVQWQKEERAAKQGPKPNVAAVRPQPSRLMPGESVGHLVIPRLGASLYVVEGAEKEDLENGPGHVVGTAMPGPTGNCVIAGHRDTVFRQLKDIHPGDEIVMETHEASYHYRVKEMNIILPTNTKCLMPTPKAELHLITCYPFYFVGNAPKRYVVSADLENVQTATAKAPRPPA